MDNYAMTKTHDKDEVQMIGNTQDRRTPDLVREEIRVGEVLLHICCGPCAEWPIASLKQEGFSLTAYFYNPNIHPLFEHRRRLNGAKTVCSVQDVPFFSDDSCEPERWIAMSEKRSPEEEGRCAMCYRIRMDRVAAEAKARGIPMFTTSLLVSPYQSHEKLIEVCEEAALRYDVKFLYRDFRPGFREGQKMAREHGVYRQKYCGCILSLEESDFREKIYRDFEGSIGATTTVL